MSPALDCPTPAKARNKLRKLPKRRPGSVVSSVSPRGSTDSPLDSHAPKRASLPLPPDLSDPKWQEYVRKGSFLRPMETSPRPERNRSRSPRKLVPEFAHLAVHDPSRHSPPASCVEELPPSPGTPPPLRSSFAARRYAKTPVLRIGQLEGCPEPTRAERTPDVELIAEQYKALLGARSCEELRGDGAEYGHDPREEPWHEHDTETRQHSIETIRSAITRRSPLPHAARQSTPPPSSEPPEAEGSPMSDATVVDFEEDAIYFKPAFTPEALSPIPEDGAYTPVTPTTTTTGPPPSPRPNALGLQICVDLLARELTSAVRRDQPPLQVWLMIEAYERLRDQIRDVGLPNEERQPLEDMFELWLRSLYRAHEKIAGGRGLRVPPDEEEIEGLQTVELD